MPSTGKSDANKKFRFINNIFYYIVVICLIISIVIMNNTWNNRRQKYAQMVKEAALQDEAYAIELKKKDNASEEQAEDVIPEISDDNAKTEQPDK